jgi:hypothetical protein
MYHRFVGQKARYRGWITQENAMTNLTITEFFSVSTSQIAINLNLPAM